MHSPRHEITLQSPSLPADYLPFMGGNNTYAADINATISSSPKMPSPLTAGSLAMTTNSNGLTVEQQQMAMISDPLDRLKYFLTTAPANWRPGDLVKRFLLGNNEQISCVYWRSLFYVTGTDITKILHYRFQLMGRPLVNSKKFEEGVFSDLRSLKPGVDASLEEPRSEFLEVLYRNGCIRTQKKQKVFYWYSVPHERLFHDALERDLKKEQQSIHANAFLHKNMYTLMKTAANVQLNSGGSHNGPYGSQSAVQSSPALLQNYPHGGNNGIYYSEKNLTTPFATSLQSTPHLGYNTQYGILPDQDSPALSSMVPYPYHHYSNNNAQYIPNVETSQHVYSSTSQSINGTPAMNPSELINLAKYYTISDFHHSNVSELQNDDNSPNSTLNNASLPVDSQPSLHSIYNMAFGGISMQLHQQQQVHPYFQPNSNSMLLPMIGGPTNDNQDNKLDPYMMMQFIQDQPQSISNSQAQFLHALPSNKENGVSSTDHSDSASKQQRYPIPNVQQPASWSHDLTSNSSQS